MSLQKALVGGDLGRYHIDAQVEIPRPKPGTMLCRVMAVALNPADWKMIDFSATPGSIGGNDFAGEVIEVGDGVTRFQKGDRIFGMAWGLNPTDRLTGSFCQYSIATEDLACKIPDSMTYEEASTFGVAIGTAGTTLFQTLELPLPGSPKESNKTTYVLVSGGATATGTIAIQLLKAAGVTPIATCSPANRELVLSLGAEEVFDYHSSTCGMEIRNYTKNSLSHVLDCVTQAETMKLCYEAMGTNGGKYVALDPFSTHIQYTRRDIKAEWLMILSLFGTPIKLSGVYGRPARPQDREFASMMFPLAERLIENGELRPHPAEVRKGGLEAIASGIEDLRSSQVKGRKLVYPIV